MRRPIPAGKPALASEETNFLNYLKMLGLADADLDGSGGKPRNRFNRYAKRQR